MTDTVRFSRVPPRAACDTRLSAGDLRLLIAICKHVDRDGWAWPSQETLAKEAVYPRGKISERTRRLADRGHIEIHTVRKKNGEFGVTRYRVIFDRAPFGRGTVSADAEPRLDVARPATSEGGTERAPSGGGNNIPDSEHPIEHPPPQAGVADPVTSVGGTKPEEEPDELAGFISRRFAIKRSDLDQMLLIWRQHLSEERIREIAHAYAAGGVQRQEFLRIIAGHLPKLPSADSIAIAQVFASQSPCRPAAARTVNEAYSEFREECRARGFHLEYPLRDTATWKIGDYNYVLGVKHLDMMLGMLRRSEPLSSAIRALEAALCPHQRDNANRM